MTTQDLVKGIDLEALEDVSGSELEQLVDIARTASDKGLTIATADTDVPVVPDPDLDIDGIIPIWWKRYIWIRTVFDGSMNMYVWNTAAVSDATYLKWQSIKVDITALTVAIAAAQSDADDANTLATTANNNATTALANAATADAKAVAAKTEADSVSSALTNGFEPPVAGKYKILYANVQNTPDVTRIGMFGNKRTVTGSPFTQINPFAVTAWVEINILALMNAFLYLGGGTGLNVIFRARLYTTVPTGHGFNSGYATAWFTHDNTQTAANSRKMIAQCLKGADPDEGAASSELIMIMPTSALGLYFKMEGIQCYNTTLEIDILGFAAPTDFVL